MKLKKLSNILLFLLLTVPCLLFTISTAQADYEIEVSIPGGPGAGTEVGLAEYISYIYVFALALVGIAALGALVYGGFQYMLSDTITSKEEAKKWIWGAIFGLILGLSAYLILHTINPDLIQLGEPVLPAVLIPPIPSPPSPSPSLSPSPSPSPSPPPSPPSPPPSPSPSPPPSPPPPSGPAIGATQWTEISFGLYCRDVLGNGWVNVDGSFCSGSSPGPGWSCCRYSP